MREQGPNSEMNKGMVAAVNENTWKTSNVKVKKIQSCAKLKGLCKSSCSDNQNFKNR